MYPKKQADPVGSARQEPENPLRPENDALKKRIILLQESLSEEREKHRAEYQRMQEQLEKLRRFHEEQQSSAGNRSVEELINDYLSMGSERAEYQIAKRFTEAIPAILKMDTEDVGKLMESPAIGSEKHREELRFMATMAMRTDIEKIL